MELLEEILLSVLKKKVREIELPEMAEIQRIVEMECYKALSKIKEIISNDDLDDPECFYKIEKIVCLFEKMGIDSGVRHDF